MGSNTILPAIKQNGAVQRSSVTLTKNICIAIRNHILAGKRFSRPEDKVEYIEIGDNGEEIIKTVGYLTANAWISRGNVIPETGEVFRDLIDSYRKELRNLKREKRAEKLIDECEKQFHRTINLRTNLPVRNMFGQLITNDDGTLVRKENHNLLRVKMDTAKYITERLDPDKYAKRPENQNNVVFFDLGSLREAKERAEQEGEL